MAKVDKTQSVDHMLPAMVGERPVSSAGPDRNAIKAKLVKKLKSKLVADVGTVKEHQKPNVSNVTDALSHFVNKR